MYTYVLRVDNFIKECNRGFRKYAILTKRVKKKQNIFYFPELVVFRKKSTSFPRLCLKRIIIERRKSKFTLSAHRRRIITVVYSPGLVRLCRLAMTFAHSAGYVDESESPPDRLTERKRKGTGQK